MADLSEAQVQVAGRMLLVVWEGSVDDQVLVHHGQQVGEGVGGAKPRQQDFTHTGLAAALMARVTSS